MRKEIKSALDELKIQIKESEEYMNYTREKKLWDSSKEAQALLQSYIDANNKVRIFHQGKFPGLEEETKKLESLFKQVQSSDEIQNWIKSQNEYQQFIWELAEYISEVTILEFAPQPRGGCCG